MTEPGSRTLTIGPPLALLLVALLSLTARADPVRLGDSELRAVIVDGRFGADAWQATDWLRGTAWLDLGAPIWPLPGGLDLSPSRPSSPQTVRHFSFAQSTDD